VIPPSSAASLQKRIETRRLGIDPFLSVLRSVVLDERTYGGRCCSSRPSHPVDFYPGLDAGCRVRVPDVRDPLSRCVALAKQALPNMQERQVWRPALVVAAVRATRGVAPDGTPRHTARACRRDIC
jgi:hypothetical protein